MKAGFIGCGAGLLAKAMEDAGIEIDFGIDINKLACKNFEKNFTKSKVYNIDIRFHTHFNWDRLLKADIWAFTLPCQSFSYANQNRTENPELLFYSLYLIHLHKPKYWFIENVPNVVKFMPKSADVKIFKMCQFGNKQKRARMFYSNFDLGLLKTGKHSVPAVTKSGNGNTRYYGYTDFETALERMGFANKGLKLLGNSNERKALIGEGVVYEMGFHIGKAILSLECKRKKEECCQSCISNYHIQHIERKERSFQDYMK